MFNRPIIGAIALALAAIFIAIITITTSPARGATCLHRPGASHGSVWWRYRLHDGTRCWYPGSRYASRRVHSRPAELRTVATETRTVPAQPVEVPATRPVRVIPITKGGVTINERIERAFDRLMIFPVVEEE